MMKRIICSLAAVISAPLAVNASTLPYSYEPQSVSTTCHMYGPHVGAGGEPVYSEHCTITYNKNAIIIEFSVGLNGWSNPVRHPDGDLYKLQRAKANDYWWHSPALGCLMNEDTNANFSGVCWDATL